MINLDDNNIKTAATIGVMHQSASYASFLPEGAQRLLSETKFLVTPDHELGERNLLNVLENLDLPSLNLGFVQSGEDVNPNDISAQPTQNLRLVAHDGAIR